MSKFITKAPFRLDLVMGGVSDLEWWKDSPGACLSMSCDFSGYPLGLEAIKTTKSNITLHNFGIGSEMFTIPIKCLNEEYLESCPEEFKLPVSAIIAGLSVAGKQFNPEKIEMDIYNKSFRMKGMGGSSVVAGSMISLICHAMGREKLTFEELVTATCSAENMAGIGGGWEDIAGVYNPGINHIVYEPNNVRPLSIRNIQCDDKVPVLLQESLLVFYSKIKASTEKILEVAKRVFDESPNITIENSSKLQGQCEKVIAALANCDLKAIGESFNEQRTCWNAITGGISASREVDEIMNPVSHDILSYREAGAGGGGTVLVMCKEGRLESVAKEMGSRGYNIREWNISDYGINVELEGRNNHERVA